jgi:lysophospholipase L1-like esterase
MKRTSRASLLAVALLVGLVAVACVEPKPVSGNRLLLVGDSLMNQSRSQVLDAVRADGWDPQIDAEGGTTIVQWSDRFPLIDYAQQPDMIVIELGTNDCGLGGCPNLTPYIDKIMRYTSSADEVLWLNTNVDASENPLIGNLEYVNNAIENACSRYPKLFCADMNSEFEGRKDLHTPDGIHWNDKGKQAFAEFIREQLEPFRPGS